MQYELLTPPNEVTIGADPEVFLCNTKRLVIPACGLIGGSKEHPVPVPSGALQEDNVMAEFNVDPSNNIDTFVANVNTVYDELVKRANTHGLGVARRASAHFPTFLLEQHPQALAFGCEPDFSAYTLDVNPTPDVNSTLRTCAGHVHVGFKAKVTDDDYMGMCGSVVQYLDWIVGLWTVIVDPDTARRERYGKAGAFRPKPYGLEYRVPSNFWLKSDALKRSIFERILLAYGLAMGGADKPSEDSIVNAINTHDVSTCHRLLGGYAA